MVPRPPVTPLTDITIRMERLAAGPPRRYIGVVSLGASALRVSAAVVIGLVLAWTTAEVVLRSLGYHAWKEIEYVPGMPRMHEPDPELGWRNKPGAYVFGQNPPIRMTFWPDHSRATAPEPRQASTSALVLGDSFTQGWAVSDEETFAWRLQERFPDTAFRNFGCAGYGTTQALLAFRRFIRDGEAPAIVIYGFSDFHEGRNVADAGWLKTLAQLASRGHVAVPYGKLDTSGVLRLYPPVQYPAWPFHEYSTTVVFFEEQWVRALAASRRARARPVTGELLLELHRAAEAAGARLLVILQSQYVREGNAPYLQILKDHRIAFADCTHPAFQTQAMRVPVYGHPNATMNAHWARCIESALRNANPPLVASAQHDGQ